MRVTIKESIDSGKVTETNIEAIEITTSTKVVVSMAYVLLNENTPINIIIHRFLNSTKGFTENKQFLKIKQATSNMQDFFVQSISDTFFGRPFYNKNIRGDF